MGTPEKIDHHKGAFSNAAYDWLVHTQFSRGLRLIFANNKLTIGKECAPRFSRRLVGEERLRDEPKERLRGRREITEVEKFIFTDNLATLKLFAI